MSILVNKQTRLIVQGITGSQGSYHTGLMKEYGTNIVAGVTPGKLGQKIFDIPIYDTVSHAVQQTGADASVIFVPPPYAADAILEAADAGIKLIVCITEGIPISDMIKVNKYLSEKETILIGPNCPGLITPGECKIGILPGSIHRKGHVGVVSRSGTLTYEAVKQLTDLGIGQSTVVGIGGDPAKGTDFIDILQMFQDDPDTYAVIMIGEIGGTGEEKAARWIKENMTKPVSAYIAGQSAPEGKRMGHAGAIISGGRGSAKDKIRTLQDCGINVALTPDKIGQALVQEIEKAGILKACQF